MSDSSPHAGSIDENARRRFEDAWASGKPIDIESCLPSADEPQYLPTLEELVSIELEFGWRVRETAQQERSPWSVPLNVEAYLVRFPRLNEPAILLRLAKQEFLARYRFGDHPTVVEYRDRFPNAVQTGNEFEDVIHLARVAAHRMAEITPGVVVGRYRVSSEHARGGFGLVWKAEDKTLSRTVAIKELDGRHTRDDRIRSRFLNEARITASLEHPGIVPIYELQDRDQGTPFYSMKMVQGQTFSQAIRSAHQPGTSGGSDRQLKRTRLLNTYLSVLRTMAFAHSRGVIHRDLKPDNIILGEYGETIILDWGLAKSLMPGTSEIPHGVGDDARGSMEAGAGTSPEMTQPGSVLGTPAYMAPEQADGRIESIDRQSDVYALGVMLYEILTGERPHKGRSSDEIIEKVLKTEPPRPRTLAADIPRPLEAICMKAMARHRADRYGTAAELSEDIERCLADLPVTVYRESVWERSARWLRRHRTVALSATGALIAVAATAVVAAVSIDRQRQQAVAARAEAVKEKDRADAALVQAQENLYVTRIQFARHRWEAGNVAEARVLLDECPVGLRAWEWRYLWEMCHGELRRWSLPEHLRVTDYSAASGRLAVASDTHLLLLNARTGETERRVELQAGEGRVRWLRFLGDASVVLTAVEVSGNPANGAGTPKPVQTRIDAWDVSTGQRVWMHCENDRLADCAVSRKGDVFVAIFRREALRLLNARTGKPLPGSEQLRHQLEGPTVAVSADGTTFAVGSWGQGVSVRQVPNGQVKWSRNFGAVDVSTLALSPDGALLAVGLRGYGSNFGRCMICGGAAAETIQLPDLARPMRALAFSGDGKHLVGAGDDRSMLLWRLREARLVRRVVGPGSISDMALAADVLVAATVGEDGNACLWDLSRDQDAVRIEPFPLPRTAAAFGPDGSWFVDATLDIRRSDTGVIAAHLGDRRSGPQSAPFDLAVSADGTLIAAAGEKREISLWRRMTPDRDPVIIPAAVPVQDQDAGPHRVAFSSRGSLLAATGRGVRLWDAEASDPKETERRLPGCDEETNGVSFSPDGSYLAASVGAEGLRIWHLDESPARLVHAIPVDRKGRSVGAIVFSPDGQWVFAAMTGPDPAVAVLDCQTGRLVRELGGTKEVSALACTPDGRRLVLAENDGGIRFVDMKNWRDVFRIDALDRLVLLKMCPRGQHLLAANWMGRIMLWRAPMRELLRERTSDP